MRHEGKKPKGFKARVKEHLKDDIKTFDKEKKEDKELLKKMKK
jgi:hypothetical protein